MILNENNIYRYSAIFETPCEKSVMVWRNKDFPHQDQLKDHIKECEECKKIIKESKNK